MMIVETLMTLGVVLAALVAVLVIHQNDRQYRIERELSVIRREHNFMIGCLTVWAEHWGEDPAVVKRYLEVVLRTGPPAPTILEPPAPLEDQIMGFGAAAVVLPVLAVSRILRRWRRRTA